MKNYYTYIQKHISTELAVMQIQEEEREKQRELEIQKAHKPLLDLLKYD